MSTSLVLYGSSVAATQTGMTSAGQLATAAGGVDSSISSKLGTATGYGEVTALGTTNAWAASAGPIGSIAPTGLGWLLDAGTLFSQQLLAGTWAPILTVRSPAGTITADLYLRAYAYDTVALTYTLIGTLSLLGQAITATAAAFTFSPASLGAYTFNANQKLYLDCFPNVTANTLGNAAAVITIKLSTAAATGVANDLQVTTPGYRTPPILMPLVVYGSNVASTTLATAAQLATTTGGVDSGVSTKVGTSTGYSELPGLGAAGAWVALGSIGAPSGRGWLLDANTLFSQQIVSGTWTPVIQCRITAGTATISFYVRAYAYDTVALTYTAIGTLSLTAQALTSTQTVYTFAGSSLAAYAFNATQMLYIDCWPNVTANSSGSTTAQIAYKLSTSASAGVVNDLQVTTPGFQSVSVTPALSVSPTALSFSATVGGASPASQNDTLSETNGAGTAWTSSISYGSGSGWLSISPTSGTLASLGTQAVAFTCTTGALAAGTYTASVTFIATTGGSMTTVVVTFTVNPLVINLTAYLSNAASVVQNEANQLYTIAGTPTTTTRDIIVGTSLKYGELTSQGTTSGGGISSPYGTTIYFSGNHSTIQPAPAKLFDLLVGGNTSGLGMEAGLVPGGPIWMRVALKWNLIEYQQGVYDWSIADDVVSRCNAANILVDFCILIPPDWRLDTDVNGNHLTTPGAANGGTYASGAATAAFATALAQRYSGASGHGTVQAFQWNEDYDTPGTNAQRTVASKWFVENWQIVGPIFRQYAPNALLIGPASRYTTDGFIHRTTWFGYIFTYQPPGRSWAGAIVDSHGASILDAGDFHYYRNGAMDLNGQLQPDPTVTIYLKDGTIDVPTPAQIISNFKQIAASHGYANFDVWCTETGWNVYNDPAKPNPYVTEAQQSQYIQASYDQHRLNGGTHAIIWVINPNAVVDLTATPSPTTTEPKDTVFNEKKTTGTKFRAYAAYTDTRDTYIPKYPNWGASSSTWAASSTMGAQTGNGWLLDPTTLEGQQFLAGNWTATMTLQAVSGGVGSGSLAADLYLRTSKYNATTGVYTTIAVTTLAGQTIGSTSAAFILTGSGILETFATGEKLYIDIFPNLTTNANANANQAIRILKISLDTGGLTGDVGARIISPGYQPIVGSASVLATSPTALTFNAAVGGASPASQTDTLSETAGVGTNWTSAIVYGSGSGWLAISPTSGTLAPNGTAAITCSCTTGSLVAGTYSATVTFTAATGGATATVTVTFIVSSTNTSLSVSPLTYVFRATVGGASPVSQNGNLSNTGGTPSAWTSSISYGSGSGWLAISPISGTLATGGSQTITYNCTAGALIAGTYTATVTFTATANGATATATVTFVVSPVVNGLTVSVAGVNVTILEKTPKVSNKVNQRSAFNFSVLDTTGTVIFRKGQPVVVSDSVLGPLWGGYVNNPKVSNLYPNAHNLWVIDTTDMVWLGDKRTSNSLYTNQYAGTIVCDQAQNILSQEGVWGNFALDYNHLLTDWTAGGATLTNVAATTNAGDGNPGDGDLELALAGAAVTLSESVSADWNNNFSISGMDATIDILQLASHATLALTGINGGNYGGAFGNAFAYQRMWAGSYTIASGDTLTYYVWVNSSSPQIMAGVDGVCTDGTTIRDFASTTLADQNGLLAHPKADLAGFANDQWYKRTINLSAMAGKILSFATVAFEGDNAGLYTAYFRDVLIVNGSTTKVTFYQGATPHAAIVQPNQNAKVSANGYGSVTLTPVIGYESTGTRVAKPTSLTGVGIYQNSVINWTDSIPVVSGSSATAIGTVAINTSIDGGATWQPATLNTPIANLLAGASLAGQTLQTQEVLTITAKDPTASPTLSLVYWSVLPSYSATKKDTRKSYTSSADWASGTLTNLVGTSGDLTINASTRNWDDAVYSNQTLFNNGATSQGIYLRTLSLTTVNGSDARSRFDFAGNTWQNFTLSIDILVPPANTYTGVVYRTTGWVNGNDTYAYLVDFSTTGINLGRGSNGGASSHIAIASAALTLTNGDWHTLTIVVSGASHTVSLDGVQYISATDATYSAAGYVGVRNNNASGATVTCLYDNFGIVPIAAVVPAMPLPQWVSPSIALGSITVGTSIVQWNAIQPNGSIVNVLASVNGGAYVACTNGTVIPGLSPGIVLAKGTLQLLVQLQAAQASVVPILQGLTVWVLSSYSATGTWISSPLPLARVANAATSLVNWNANLPQNTSLAVKTSVNGGASYQAIATAGSAIPNIGLQPLPTTDTFTANTSANYTQTRGAGGANAISTWDTANSRLRMVGGTSGLVLANSPSGVSDVDLLGVFGQAEDSGLVWRYTNANTYYELVVRDAGASTNANTYTLNRMSGGVLTQIMQRAIVFNASTYHVVRVTMTGGVIIAFFDGTQILTYTDGSPLAAGLCGLRNSTGTSYCSQLRIQPQGQNVSALTVITELILTSTDPTVTPQVLDTATLVADPTIGAGVLIPSAQYQGTYVSTNIDDCNKKSNYWWTLTQAKQLLFQAQNATPAPRVLQSSDAATTNILVQGLQIQYGGSLYRNRMVLKNANATSTQPQVFVGNDVARTWTLAYPVAANTIPVITLNGVAQTVGIQGVDTGKSYYYQVGSTSISQDSSLVLLAELDQLSVTYTGAYLTTVTRDNTGQFAGTTSQGQYAAIDNTSGIIECVVDLSQDPATANMTVADAQVYGDGLLQRYGVIGRTASFQTLQAGLAIGQQLSVFIPSLIMINVQMLVSQVDITETITTGGAVQYWYSVVAVEGPALDHWTKIFGTLLR